jgi:competence protein ComEC
VWIAGVARFFADLPWARLPWPEGEGGAAMLAVLSALGVIAMFSRARTRKWATFSLCVALAVYSGVVGGGSALGRLGRPDWQIAACEVGQGDSFVVRSVGQIAVIDVGKDPEALRSCLDDIGVSRIDLLVLTHFDLDHVGGVGAIRGKVNTALVGEVSSPADEELLGDLAAGGADVQTAAPGSSGVLGQLAWRIIWPAKRVRSLEPGNDASVVIEFRPAGQCSDGCLSSVFLGDVGAVAQARLLASGALSTVDVIKVSHHGSADQDARLYLAANATVGLIGVGENSYGHPDQRALDMLTAAGTSVQRTDLDGLTLVAPGATPGAVVVWTQR